MLRLVLSLGLMLWLVACAAQQTFSDDASIAAVSYRQPGPPSLTLYTIVNNRSGSGGHTALLINASERVMFDPAGSFYLDIVPERNDLLYGITPRVEQAYRSAHARSSYHVMTQTIDVTPEQAQIAYELAKQAGPVAQVFCASATSAILRQIPGFERIDSTLYPNALAKSFGKLPGVRTEKYYEQDSPDLQKALAEGNAAILAEQG